MQYFWQINVSHSAVLAFCKLKMHTFLGKDRCYSPMGIQNYAIPDASFTASGVLSLATPPAAARLYLQKGQSLDGAWCESNSTKVYWFYIILAASKVFNIFTLMKMFL